MGCKPSKHSAADEEAMNRPPSKAKTMSRSSPIIMFWREDACPSGKTVTFKFKLSPQAGSQTQGNENEAFFYNGQYGLFQFFTQPPTVRQYTMWHDPESPFDACCITVKLVEGGVVSSYLHGLQVATSPNQKLYNCSGYFHWMDLRQETPDPDSAQRVVMVAGGAGVVPMYSLLLDLFETPMASTLPPHDVVLAYSEKEEADLCFLPNLKKWVASSPNAHGHSLTLSLYTTRETVDGCISGRITAKSLSDTIPDIRDRYILTCGPGDFHDSLVKQCNDVGIKGPFYTELFINNPSGMPMSP